MNTTMIFGAPGCGKTTYLINLLEDVLKRYDPDKVAFVSFTKKGSYEGRDRAMEHFGYKEKDFPFFRTIHSLAFRALGMSKMDMISKRRYKEFSKAMGMNFVGYYTEDFVNNDDKYLFYHSLNRNNPYVASRFLEDLNVPLVKRVSFNYEKYKKTVGIKDFDDLIIDFIDKGQTLPVEVAIIDEAQDLTSLQWKFCNLAFRNCKEIYVAGDDDQAIYEWSGADVEYFLSLTKDNKVKVLDKSYRLKRNVLELSEKISSLIKNRVEKKIAPVEEGGNIIFTNSLRDVPISNEETYYFLCRNTYFLSEYKNYLKSLGMVFTYKGLPSVSIHKYNAIKLYEKYRQTETRKFRPEASYSPYLRKDCEFGGVWYDVFEFEEGEELYFRDLFKNKTDVSDCKINVNTIHGVKGGEADNVVLKLNITKKVLQSLDKGTKEFEAEVRCLYVALTRAKKNLYIVHSDSKFGYDEILLNIRRGYYE